MRDCDNCVHHIDDVCEHCYELNVNTCTGFRSVTPQGEIRWTDKVYLTSSGDIIDFEGRVVGHINLEEMKGGAE